MAITSYYVSDTGDNGNGGTSWVDAWRTPEYALDTGIIAQGTYGDELNIRGVHTLTQRLDQGAYFSSYTPTRFTPFIFRGEEAASSGFNGGAARAIWDNTAKNVISFDALELYNVGSNPVIRGNDYYTIQRCKVHGTSTVAVDLDADSAVIDCELYDIGGTYGVYFSLSGGRMIGNLLHAGGGSTPSTAGLGWVGASCFCYGNILKTSSGAIRAQGASAMVGHNSIFSPGAITGKTGIQLSYHAIVYGNVVSGYTGVASTGIYWAADWGYFEARNAVYNCTTPYRALSGSVNGAHVSYDNETLGSDPFADAANDDFTPQDVGNVKGGSLPSFGLWLPSSAMGYPWKGAIQPQGAGSTVVIQRPRRIM